MGENTESNDKETKRNEKKNSKKVFIAIVSLLVLFIFLIGGYIAHILNKPKEEPAKEKPTIGIIRIKDAIKAHKEYEEIGKLREQYETIMTEIMALSEPVEIELPENNDELFTESAQQKLSQKIVDKIAELEEKRRAAVEKYVKDTEADYEKKRAEIDERYLTAIADLRMKLDNADILRLSDAKVNELSEQLAALQHERGEAQDALKAEREREIYNYGEKVIDSMSGEIKSIDAEANKLMSEVSLKQSEAMERNMRILSESMGEDRIAKIHEKESEMESIKEELLAKEDKILADISSAAAKYALQNNLELVLADNGMNLEFLLPPEFQTGDAERYSKVIALNSLDITDSVVNDLLIDEK